MSSENGVKLLGAWASPFVIGVLIALEEKGIEYEYVEQDLMSKTKSPLLLELNPVHKKVPVLIHNGRPVAESAIILQYIDEQTRLLFQEVLYSEAKEKNKKKGSDN
ncbi:hypothetical protein SUGI_0342190 [Cryptomeria japonica]|nr:hypothetical protein SUGI_0342190 [Cryptomeria japonica]